MKVEKITITKQLLDLPTRPHYKVAVHKPIHLNGGIIEGDEMNFIQDQSQVEDWVVEEVYNPMDIETKKRYLIKVDERGLFTELLTIHDDILNKELTNQFSKGEEKGYHEGHHDGKKAMRNAYASLPWYKRLFNILY